jgi:hypothetical protein
MAFTEGRVSTVYIQSEFLCIYLEYAPNREALFLIQFLATDGDFVTEQKRCLAKLIIIGWGSGRTIRITHDANDSLVDAVELMLTDISPVGPAVHGDFYSVTGEDIPGDAVMLFETDSVAVTVVPELRRPHWVMCEQLPASVPAGHATVRLTAPGYSSERVPILVASGPPEARRPLYTGKSNAQPPYTFVLAATPGVQGTDGTTIAADPVLADRPSFHDVVRHCIVNLLTVTEPLLRQENLEANIRFVSIFDTAAPVNAANTLVGQVASSTLIGPIRERMNGFAGRYFEDPDVVYALSGNSTHTRASAQTTTDDAVKPGVSFTYDGTARTHRRHTSIPGSAAISTLMDQSGLTSIHEFGHAASDNVNGAVLDLYNDNWWTGFIVNKKRRANATDAIPAAFGTYDGTSYNSDQNRTTIGYPTTWRTYHAAPLDAARPNMMDNYWLAPSQVQACRFDGLTFEWFLDRLRAKILR